MTVALAAPAFPPLFQGRAEADDPFGAACRAAAAGVDAGTVFHDIRADRMRAAIVFAPEVPLREAIVVLPVCGVGFQNALGALAPPEVGVFLGWSGEIRVNGAVCGRLTPAASTPDPGAVPDWLVIGLDLALILGLDAPGETPDQTGLYEEGCAEVDPVRLLEAWTRHTLVWLNRWQQDGPRPVYQEWKGMAHGIGETVEFPHGPGTFTGLDDHFGMVVTDAADGTRVVPLTALLQET